MSFMGKLAFWKKKDEFSDLDLGIGKDIGGATDLGLGHTGDLSLGAGGFDYGQRQQPSNPFSQQPVQQMQQFGQPAQPVFQQQPQSHQEYTLSKDIEVISSKLDALRASLDSISQRLANIERIAYGEQEQQRRRAW